MLGTEYAHALLGQRTERRNSCEQSSLGQALGGQLVQTNTTNSPVYSPEAYHLTPASPQSIQASSSRAESRYPSASTSPTLKRKHAGDFINTTTPLKRKRDQEDGSEYEDGTAQSSKHWTDDEKSRLFNWLMAVGQDEHWQSLRATKNSCLRECASNVYEGRKSYQALKGCYERNFNLFKQLYALEMYNEQIGNPRITAVSFPDEEERGSEYDRRLQRAREAGVDVKGVSARILDHWQNRTNWYDLFYSRWHGDPATTRPIVHRSGNALTPGNNEPDGEDDLTQLEHNLSVAHSQSIHSTMVQSLEQSLQFIHHEPHREQRPSLSEAAHVTTRPSDSLSSHTSSHPATAFIPSIPSHTHTHTPLPSSHAMLSPTVDSSTDPLEGGHPENIAMALPLTQAMYTHIIQYMQSQNHYRQMKLEYLRRRQEREEAESLERRNLERARHELEISEMERRRHAEYIKQKQEWAYQVVNTPLIDPEVKQTATDFLKSLFS